MLLWLDDQRNPEDYGCGGWTWVKTVQEAAKLLATQCVMAVSLDHDLGTVQTGHDVVVWLEETGFWPRHGVFVHSANALGGARMQLTIDRKYPELARHRQPLMTPLEQGIRTNFLVRRSLEED